MNTGTDLYMTNIDQCNVLFVVALDKDAETFFMRFISFMPLIKAADIIVSLMLQGTFLMI